MASEAYAPSTDAPRGPEQFLPLALVIFLVLLQEFWTGACAYALVESKFVERRYGPEYAEAVRSPDGSAASKEANGRLTLWAMTLGFPLWFVTVLLLVRHS